MRNSTSIQNEYIDPQIIFSSRRWWNYDIFIHDIYASQSTQLTKNQWIDFNPQFLQIQRNYYLSQIEMETERIYSMELEWLDGYTQWRGNNLTNITNSKENDWTPSFSPIDDKIVFTTYFPENDNYDIFIMKSDGSDKENLTKSKSYEKFPKFSPDGTFIIYQGWSKGKMDIFFLSILDKNIINITRNSQSNDIIHMENAFSPDGQSIVFTSERDGNKNIFITKIYDPNPEQLTFDKADDYEPIYSPDGQSIVFTSERDGNKEIYLLNVESKTIKNSLLILVMIGIQDSIQIIKRLFFNHLEMVIGRYILWQLMVKSNQLTNHPSTDYSYIVLPLKNP